MNMRIAARQGTPATARLVAMRNPPHPAPPLALFLETFMLPTARKLDFTDVPVIDLAPAWSGGDAGRRAVADTIADACGRVGFFYVKNHGLTDADIAAIFQTAADFHNLPLDAKMEVSLTKNNHAQG